MTAVLALASAFFFGAGIVFQRRAALEIPAAEAATATMLAKLLQRPMWLLGVACDLVAFGFQAWALSRGSLVVVQPIVSTALLFALVLMTMTDGETVTTGEWHAIVLVLLGLTGFLAASAPTFESVGTAAPRAWLTVSALVIGGVLLLVASGRRAGGAPRAALFGLAAGVADAFMAVLAKAFAGSIENGVAHTFATWMPYAVAAGGITALLLASTAYQAGHPTVALPLITITNPVVGAVIGIGLFSESLRLDGLRGPLVVLSIAAMAWGLLVLTRDTRLAPPEALEPKQA